LILFGWLKWLLIFGWLATPTKHNCLLYSSQAQKPDGARPTPYGNCSHQEE
jgi:hypothetical protein